MTIPKLHALKRIVRKVYPVKVPQPQWGRLLGRDFEEWKSLVTSNSTSGHRILLAPTIGHPGVTVLDSLLAIALTLRNAQVEVLLCDEVLPACHMSLLARLPHEQELLHYGPKRDLCPTCFYSGYEMLSSLGIRIRRFSQYLSKDDLHEAEELSSSIPAKDIPSYAISGVAVGEHALAGAIRFFARSSLEREKYGEQILRRYFNASLLSRAALTRLFDEFNYSCASFHHGIYVPQGVIGDVARQKNVRVVNWAVAYRKNTFIFTHDHTYHHTLMSEPVSNWIDMHWNKELESEIVDYLKSRWSGARDWISFNRMPEEDQDTISQTLGVNWKKPCIGLLTNVVWDAQLHYPQNAFPNMIEWLMTTIRYFVQRPELQLIIRVHPAELSGQIVSRQPIVEEIKQEFPQLPKNVFVIPPESKISTYSVMMQCDSVLIYGTKTGVELTSFGIPVIVAGEAWIRNKGLTIDVSSEAHYREVLDDLPLGYRLDGNTTDLARRYAYHYFFRRMIPLTSVSEEKGNGWCPYGITVGSLADLQPGKDLGLDVICDGILNGREFIYPAEQIQRNKIEDSVTYATA